MAKILFWLIFGLYTSFEIYAVDNKGLLKDLPQISRIKKHLHVDKLKALLLKRAPLHAKGFKYKNHQDRCIIICPIILPPIQNCTDGYIKPATKTTTVPSTASTEETFPETDSSTISSSNENVSTSNEEIESRNKPFKPIELKDHLNSHQKRIILKQLRLGNNHGKKAYRYRQIGSNLCLVQCHSQDDLNNLYHQSPLQEIPDEDVYVEGEDTPIEYTMTPGWPQNDVISGIRPFGNVDFIGLDDFGPSGELARYPFNIFEEKTILKKMEKAKKNGKNLRKNALHTNVQVKA